jgi:dihydroneopterin aldolase
MKWSTTGKRGRQPPFAPGGRVSRLQLPKGAAAMFTSIHIFGPETWGYPGVFEEERTLGQKFAFDVRARLKRAKTQGGDDLSDSVRSDELVEEAVSLATGCKFQTQETLAEAVALTLLARFEALASVDVRVSEESPLIPRTVEQVSVEVALGRDDLAEA